MSKIKAPFAVRKQTSGRTRSITWIVVRNPNGRRVSTWPHVTRESAQAAADRLNAAWRDEQAALADPAVVAERERVRAEIEAKEQARSDALARLIATQR